MKKALLTLTLLFSMTSFAQTPEYVVEFILDASGSMLMKEKGEVKIKTAKKMMAVAIEAFEQEKALSALRVFGHKKPRNCNKKLIEQKLGFYPKNFVKTKQLIEEINPVERGMTPIAESLKQSFESIKDLPGKKRIIVITDGEETCGGDPCAEAAKLRDELDVKIYVLTYGAKTTENFKELSCLGPVKNADSPEGFGDALSEFKFDALNTKQTIIVKGPEPDAWAVAKSKTKSGVQFRFVSSLGTNLPPDTYDVEVQYEPKHTFKDVVLPPNDRKVLVIDGRGQMTLEMPSFPIQLIAQDILTTKEYVFYAGDKIKLPVSRYNVFATTTTGLAHQWDNITITPNKLEKLEPPNWGLVSVLERGRSSFDIVSKDTESPSRPDTKKEIKTELKKVTKFKNDQAFFLTNNRYVLGVGAYTLVHKGKKYEIKVQKGKLISVNTKEGNKIEIVDLLSNTYKAAVKKFDKEAADVDASDKK